MIDGRLKNTKCAKCINGHDFILECTLFTICADCKDRPNRDKDGSRFEPDVKSEWLKELLDAEARKGPAADY